MLEDFLEYLESKYEYFKNEQFANYPQGVMVLRRIGAQLDKQIVELFSEDYTKQLEDAKAGIPNPYLLDLE